MESPDQQLLKKRTSRTEGNMKLMMLRVKLPDSNHGLNAVVQLSVQPF